MNLQEHTILFIAVIGVLALVVASPALSRLLVFPQTDFFTKETIKRILEKCKKEGVPVEQAKEALVRHGLDRRLAERFIQEIVEEEP